MTQQQSENLRFTEALSSFMLEHAGYLKTIPRERLEKMVLDGCNFFQTQIKDGRALT